MAQEFIELADGVEVFHSSHDHAHLLNTGIFTAGKKALVVDTQLYLKDIQKVKDRLRRKGVKARYVVNTHWHGDHVYGNQLFKGVDLISHVDTPTWMAHELPKYLDAMKRKDPHNFEEVRLVYPFIRLNGPAILDMGNEEVHIMPQPGHTR
ncbi:MAG TPA: MBL fold metallo-hydrolase, partial [Candidatus Hodarchaeales archaeon]|nr:MBL fold metallo-hydrolase [Candidatus Hodarchaeales archaeon]